MILIFILHLFFRFSTKLYTFYQFQLIWAPKLVEISKAGLKKSCSVQPQYSFSRKIENCWNIMTICWKMLIYIYIYCRLEHETSATLVAAYPWDQFSWNEIKLIENSWNKLKKKRENSDQDRMPVCQWAWRMERAVDHHMAVRERELAEEKKDHEMKMAEGRRQLFMTAGIHFWWLLPLKGYNKPM